ncbi:U6 snRNA phosphodiesterase Usb1 [Nemania serpens]|nr:U6 snRNA phosphodiesterase Usb1 [Nemania serpens]
MGLVDYSSDSSVLEEDDGPRAKRQKTSDKQTSTKPAASHSTTTKSELPPLPSAFHDLYASTVRVSASDDPSLHQGRKRVNPHKVGNWPSHLYIEWHPTPTEQKTLTALLSTLQSTLASQASSPSSPPAITSFLTSDLGAPQPLHISLSRPIVLGTPQKDEFLSGLRAGVRASGVAPFALAPLGAEWHRTAESARSFLVLRVGDPGVRAGGPGPGPSTNPQLAALLARSNALVAALGQPALYDSAPSRDARGKGEGGGGSANADVDVDVDVDGAFHVSIAWSFAPPDAELRRLTAEAFHGPYNRDCEHNRSHNQSHNHDHSHKHRDGGEEPEGANPMDAPTTTNTQTSTTFRDAVAAMRIHVDGIKAKIGNVVTHVPLPDARGRSRGMDGGGIFGV